MILEQLFRQAIWCCLLLGLLAQPLTLQADTANNKATKTSPGKHLYQTGQRQTGVDLTAYVGRASIPMPANSLPCASCHGRDGKGRPEGGVKPSNINWSWLTKSYGGTSSSGRKFGTYNEDRFLKAITEGVDPAGNQLDSSMPRYNLSRHDARELIKYLKQIENEFDPGITDKSIVFASLQPATGWQAQLGQVITSTVNAVFADLNEAGGIYGRKLKLETLTYKDNDDFKTVVSKTLSAERYFAMLGSFSGNEDQTLTDHAEQQQIPSIAPFTNHLTASGDAHRYTFYIYGGLDTQVQALLKKAATDKTADRYLIVHANNFVANARKAGEFLQQQGIRDVAVLAYKKGTSAWSKTLKTSDTPTRLVFLGASGDLAQVYQQLSNKQPVTTIYLPGMLAGRDILKLPKDVSKKVALAYHVTPQRTIQLQEFTGFMQKHGFDRRGMSIRLFAYGAARITIEGLKRAGKRLSREQVVAQLEKLYDFDAGMDKPVRYDPRRRIGLRGAYIVKLDQQQNRLKGSGDWVSLD